VNVFPQQYVEKAAFDRLGGVEPIVEIRPVGPDAVHCTATYRLDRETSQDDWQCRITPAFRPDFHWSPHLTPTDRHVADQHSFRSPALIVQDQERTMLLIPDLDLLAAGSPARWYLDLDAQCNTLTIGMSRVEVREHVLFERAPGAVYPPGSVAIGFYLIMLEGGEAARNPWRTALDFMWQRWGGPAFRSQAAVSGSDGAPLETYVRHAYDWAFKHWQDAVWQQFELDGRTVGAPVFIADVSQSPSYPGVPSERESRSIWNQAWFSSLRSAQGLYRWGRRTGDSDLIRRALLTKELALSAPRRSGFFPAVLAVPMDRIAADGREVNRSRGWDESFWGNSNRNPADPWGSLANAPYHVLDMSWTSLLMLRWHRELEPDQRLVEYARSYADALLALQDEDGFFPAWLDAETLQPMAELAQSPETSMSVTFLLELHAIVPDGRYRDAALKAMEAVLDRIVPEGRWEDFETYWSCSPYGQAALLGRKVQRNNMYKQCNLSMFWTAEALLGCYRLTNDGRWLAAGERCLDEMLMTQASWQPPYLYVDTLGGFGVMNADGEWNDARQSLFAELILQYGLLQGRDEYIERGLAALRASFYMMYCPENERTKAQWERAHPFFGERDYGFMMENYGHDGFVSPEGAGMGTFAIYDWGAGAAAEAYLRIRAHLGSELLERYGYTV
jgi:hypothetical protein